MVILTAVHPGTAHFGVGTANMQMGSEGCSGTQHRAELNRSEQNRVEQIRSRGKRRQKVKESPVHFSMKQNKWWKQKSQK